MRLHWAEDGRRRPLLRKPAIIVAIGALALLGVLASVLKLALEPEATSTALTPDDLETIIVSQATAPQGAIVEDGPSGVEALGVFDHSGAPALDTLGFVEARSSRIGDTDPSTPPDRGPTGGIMSWTALYETESQAESAYAALVAMHESGWRLPKTELGDGTVHFSGPAYGWETAEVYVWRVDSLVLVAAGMGYFNPEVIRSLALAMNDRASRLGERSN